MKRDAYRALIEALDDKEKIYGSWRENIAAIKSGVISLGNISFDTIRCLAISPTPPDVHNELNYGHAILDSQDQLNKYIYAYGSMIKH